MRSSSSSSSFFFLLDCRRAPVFATEFSRTTKTCDRTSRSTPFAPPTPVFAVARRPNNTAALPFITMIGEELLIGGKLVIGGLRLFSFAVVVATHTHTRTHRIATPINAQLGSYYLPINPDTSVHSLTLATLLARFTWPTLKYAPRSDGFARVNYRARTTNRSLVNRQPARRFKRGGLFDRPLCCINTTK